MEDLICGDCHTEWSMEKDDDGLFDGSGTPPCPKCSGPGMDPSDYGDWTCPSCANEWRVYGNGGLTGYGTWPNCPDCGSSAEKG